MASKTVSTILIPTQYSIITVAIRLTKYNLYAKLDTNNTTKQTESKNMPKNFNTAPTATPDEDPLKVMQEAQIDGVYEDTYEAEATEADFSPEDTVEDAAERLTLAEQGAQTIEDLKDRYGEQYEDFKENAKSKLRGFGRAAGAVAKKAGLFIVGAGVVGVAAGVAAAGQARQNMRDRKANRQAVYEQRIQQQRDEAYDEAVQDNEMYDLHTEALAENVAYDEKYESARNYYGNILPGDADGFNSKFNSTSGEVYGSAERNARQDVLNDAYDEAFAENEKLDEAKDRERADYEAKVAARYASFVAYQRKAARRQKYESLRNKGSEIYQKASGKTRQFGRAVASFAKRSGKAVVAGARATRDTFKETA